MTASKQKSAVSRLISDANKLAARAKALGIISKKGLDLTSQQGEELLAAAAGHRSRHSYRKALETQPAVQTSCQDTVDAVSAWNKLLYKQAWKGDTLAGVLMDFIHEQNLMCELSAYAHERVTGTIDRSGNAALIKLELDQMEPILKDAGYSISEMDGAFYWEDLMQASEDYPTELEAARGAAFEIADTLGITSAELESMNAAEQASALRNGAPSKDVDSAAALLEADWGYEHPVFTKEDWKFDASNEDTKLGYWPWVVHNEESDGGYSYRCADCQGMFYALGGGEHIQRDARPTCGCATAKETATDPLSFSILTACGSGTKGNVALQTYNHAARFSSTATLDEVHALLKELGVMAPFGDLDRARRQFLDTFVKKATEVADTFYENFDFGGVVAATGGWDHVNAQVFQRSVFVENEDPELDSIHYKLTVSVIGLQVIDHVVSRVK